MTCTNCHYQWCWLCEKKYSYGHYRHGRCNGHQFTKANNINELPEIPVRNIENRERRFWISRCCRFLIDLCYWTFSILRFFVRVLQIFTTCCICMALFFIIFGLTLKFKES